MCRRTLASSGLIMLPAAAAPKAPATAPAAPPTTTPTGPANTPPPISADFDSRSASSGSSGTCAAGLGSCDGTPWPGRACSARSGSAGVARDGGVAGEFICVSQRQVDEQVDDQANLRL